MVAAAHARLARMLCTDAENCPLDDVRALAREVHNRQLAILRVAWDEATRPARPECAASTRYSQLWES